ncbi:Zinc finger C2H2 superfamily [Arabidopsis suecica]|uniref:Zinc finger C2H2 superfamily n=1 Tax=Arabidopsis suecica TaxID=45249 RepID=A0A8T2H5N0_ARASU|nr:Zinc finger C2H2 superfamily [Arabidopsis suecica]
MQHSSSFIDFDLRRSNFQMEEGKENSFLCKYCYKTFPSGKALGGHIGIHTNENSVGYNSNKKKRLVDQRKMMAQKHKQQQVGCRECGRVFVSLKALRGHMACHGEVKKMLMDDNSQSDTESETSSAPMRKRSKRVVIQSNSESLSNGSSSFGSEIDQERRDGAYNLMMLSSDSSSFKKRRNMVMNSLGESSDNNSAIVENKSSSGDEFKIMNVKNVVDDQWRSADDDGVSLCDSDGSDSDYFMNGPSKSESDISVDRNTGFGSGFNNSLNRFRNSNEGGTKYELSKSKRALFSYETDSCADTNSKIHHRFKDSKSSMVKKEGGEKVKSKGHECPICFRMFKSGQALGGHKRSHSIANHAAEMRNQIDLYLPVSDTDE